MPEFTEFLVTRLACRVAVIAHPELLHLYQGTWLSWLAERLGLTAIIIGHSVYLTIYGMQMPSIWREEMWIRALAIVRMHERRPWWLAVGVLRKV